MTVRSNSRTAFALLCVVAGFTPARAAKPTVFDFYEYMQRMERHPNTRECLWVAARVENVVSDKRELVLSHGAIPRLDMPAMTMAFAPADAAAFGLVHRGDWIDIRVVRDDGSMRIVDFRSRGDERATPTASHAC
ncbi:MAG: copper-binding protein [Hyphomicrobiales bacterium]|nr:copper-binding protein [Hyphomicrobiales bacterium]